MTLPGPERASGAFRDSLTHASRPINGARSLETIAPCSLSRPSAEVLLSIKQLKHEPAAAPCAAN